MKVLANVHLYPPDHCAGAEMMLHEILLGLQAHGHEVQVIVNETTAAGFEGVPLHSRDAVSVDDYMEWADIVVTHLDRTRDTVGLLRGRRPLVHLVHNDKQLIAAGVRLRDAQLVVANSQWLAKAIRWRGQVIVIPPPVTPARYQVDNRDARAITLINMMADKGANVFWELAETFGEKPFIAVVGGYGRQVIPDIVPDNVTVVAHTPDIRDVYKRTRILLMPSVYESWGRCGIEAAASGIPTIAHPTPGLLESLRGSGIFVNRADITGWCREILALDDPDIYAGHREHAYRRSAELHPAPAIDHLEAAMLALLPNGA